MIEDEFIQSLWDSSYQQLVLIHCHVHTNLWTFALHVFLGRLCCLARGTRHQTLSLGSVHLNAHQIIHNREEVHGIELRLISKEWLCTWCKSATTRKQDNNVDVLEGSEKQCCIKMAWNRLHVVVKLIFSKEEKYNWFWSIATSISPDNMIDSRHF